MTSVAPKGRPSACTRLRGDGGAVVVIGATSMVAILIIAAIVVDLGYVRAQRREAQKEVDLAALAAGAELASLDGSDPVQACVNAVLYLRHNIGDLPDGADVPCEDLPSSCDSTTEKVAVTDGASASPYAIVISYPVPDSDIVDADVPGGLRTEDGQPCERMSVELQRTSNSFFGSIVGEDELEVLASAVVRRKPGESARVPNLWLLEPLGCMVLNASGGSGVVVGTATQSGLITLDSSGDGSTCTTANDFVLDVNGTGSLVKAQPSNLDPPGEISLVAFTEDQTSCADGNLNACDDADTDAGILTPVPTRRPSRATRAYVDWVYNCKDDYPDYGGDGGSIPIIDCPDAGELPPYVDLLMGVDGSVTGGYANQNTQPASWTLINPSNVAAYGGTSPGSNTCRWSSTRTIPTGNIYFDCNVQVNNVIMNLAGGNVIVDGSVAVQGSGGELVVNGSVTSVGGTIVQTNPQADLPGVCSLPATTFVASACYQQSSQKAAWMLVRGNGGVAATSSGRLAMNHASLFLRDTNSSATNTNTLRTSSGAGMEWTSPDQGPFMGLSVWGERSSANDWALGGNGAMSLEGVFFTPEANPFRLNGGSALTPQQAQFISRRLSLEGGTQLNLSPAGLKLIKIPPPAAFLIR